jgi:hypothetical protein
MCSIRNVEGKYDKAFTDCEGGSSRNRVEDAMVQSRLLGQETMM